MDAIILAAGRGERLRPITDSVPKPLIQVGDQRLIEYSLARLAAVGVNHVVINCAHLAEQFPDTLGAGHRYGLDIEYSLESTALETGGGILRALPMIRSDPFLIVNGDIWIDFDFRWQAFEPRDLADLLLVGNPGPSSAGDFELHANRIRNPSANSPTFTYSGVARIRKSLFRTSRPGRFSITPLLRQAAGEDRVSGSLHHGAWFDCGTPKRLEALRAHVKHSRSYLEQ